MIRLLGSLLALTLASVTALAQTSAATGWDHLIEVSLREPVAGQPALGAVDVVVDVLAAAGVAKVEFFVDGELVATVSEPPYRLRVDLGEENRDHQLRVVAHDRHGARAEATVGTRAIPFGGELVLSLQQLYVTALAGEERVTDLGQQAFVIRDQGIEQEIVTFEAGDVPFTAVLLIDSSSSMRGARLEAAQAGASAFMRRMQALDQASLLAFSDRLLARTPFTNDPQLLADELTRTKAQGGTAIHDYLFMAIKLLEQRQGRRVLVLLSDGIDSHSVVGMEQVMAKAHRSQVLIYWIRLLQHSGSLYSNGRLREIYTTWRRPKEYHTQIAELLEAVEASGGRTVEVNRAEEIAPVFVDILNELREQYALGYYPSNNRNDRQWHQVEVEVRQRRVRLRTHRGYVDF